MTWRSPAWANCVLDPHRRRWENQGSVVGRARSAFWRPLLGWTAATIIAVLGGSGLVAGASATSLSDPALVGSWSAPFSVGVKGIHSSVLPNGKVLLFSYPVTSLGSDASVWDPVTGVSTDVSLNWARDIFCSGHSLLADGRLFITGGHVHSAAYGLGVRNTDFFDPATNTFGQGPLLSEERWYPTNVELANGHVLIFGGYVNTKTPAPAPDVDSYDPALNTITRLPSTATKVLGNYPRLHLLWNGKIPWTNVKRTQIFDPTNNTWSASASMNAGGRGQSDDSVLLPGLKKVLEFGGAVNGVATATAEVVDFSAPTPQWQYTGSMNSARVWANAVLLPDGNVLAVGGGSGGSYTNPVYQSELYNPATGTWSVMASQQAPRIYHSTAVLLPDGRVLSAGMDNGSYQTTAELYSPPYLFRGPRPTIASAPQAVGYGQPFSISTPDASSITRVALVRPSSVTHSISADQRYVDLSFQHIDDNTLSVTSPANGNEAPPGPYMLFILTSTGVPSVASWMNVEGGAGPPPPSITGFDPTSGQVGTQVDVAGSGFTGVSAVAFNGVPSQFTVASSSELTATVPAGATTGRISVTAAGGTATSTTDFIVTGAPPPPAPYRDAVLGDGPRGYWRLGETSGGAIDETGNSAAGAYRGGVTLGVPGALIGDPNTAVHFNGADAYVNVRANASLDVGDIFTYELWLRRGSTLGVTQRLLHKGAGAASLGLGTSNKVVLLPGGSGAVTIASSRVAITDHNWHYIVATKNGPDVHIYLDGSDVTSAGTNTTMTNNTTALNIGRATTGVAYFDGDIDEVAIYPVALTAAQVLAHYQAGTG